MTLAQELREAMSICRPGAVCLGGTCYLPLEDGKLAKAEFISTDGGYYNGIRLTILNRRTGPVDSLTISFWDLPHSMKKVPSGCKESAEWDVHRSVPDMDVLSETVEEYLSLFCEPDPEMR